jgi:hypothetical protein
MDRKEYPPRNLIYSPIALKKFYNKYLDKPRPLCNLGYWIECNKRDIEPLERFDDDLVPENQLQGPQKNTCRTRN